MSWNDPEKYYIKTKFKESVEPDEIIFEAEKIKSDDFGDSFLEKKLEVPIGQGIFIFFLSVIVLCFIIFSARAFQLQILDNAKYNDLAEKNRIHSLIIPAPRGIIYDRFGSPLVRNIASVNVLIDPLTLPRNLKEINMLADKLSQVLVLPKKEIQEDLSLALKIQEGQKILLASNIDHDKYLILEADLKNLPGINLESDMARDYFLGSAFSHILGYMGKMTNEEKEKYKNYTLSEKIGKSGLEARYEEILHGQIGFEEIETDSMGREQRILNIKQPRNGFNLLLSIDAGLQNYLYEKLNALKQSAIGVAIDPRNGQVLAMVSAPSFNNNDFSKPMANQDFQKIINDPNKPLLNRVINGEYPPGSTIKPILATAGLEENIINTSTKINDSAGEIFVGNFRFGDWKTHGVVDIIKAIAESCDVFFYYVGGGYGNFKGLGVDKIGKYLKLFGFGESTGIDLPSEGSGLVPTEQWRQNNTGGKWYIGDTYHLSIGQGDLLVTPLQLAMATSAIANHGTLYEPQIVDAIVDENKKIISDIPPKIERGNFISVKNIDIARQGMRAVITAGSAMSLSDLPFEVAGKTGTAQFGGNNDTHAWFTAFAPFNNPRIVLVILVEGGGEGSGIAVPIAKDVLKWYFNK